MTETTPHFLDDTKYDWSKPEAQELYEVLVSAYDSAARARMIVASSGIDRNEIHFGQPPRDFWREILEVAAKVGSSRKLGKTAISDRSIAAYHPRLFRLLGRSPVPPEAPVKKRIVWKGKELVTGKQETFLDMSFLHEALRCAAAVVRLGTVTPEEQSFTGSGFLIASNTILTNYHVLHDGNGRPINHLSIWFNYENDATGKQRKVDSYEGDVSTIVGDAEVDWAIVRSKKPIDKAYPTLSLFPSKPVAKGDFVYIVQHPKGGIKKIGLSHNEVTSVTPDWVQYLTDTLPGSSGSPVCNELWQVVALHCGGIEADPNAGASCKNEGAHIDRVVEGLVARGILSVPQA